MNLRRRSSCTVPPLTTAQPPRNHRTQANCRAARFRPPRVARCGDLRLCSSVADGAVRPGVDGSQSGQGATELGFPGPAWGRCCAGQRVIRPAREKNRRQGLGGHHLLTQTGPRCPTPGHAPRCIASQAAKRPDGMWFSPTRTSRSRVLDLGMAAVVGLQLQGFPVPVGDEAGSCRWRRPPAEWASPAEPHRCGVGLTLEGGAGGLGHIGGAVHPVWDGRPVRLGYGLDQVPQAFVLADGDGEAYVQLAADGYHAMGVEAAVGPHRELPAWPLRSAPAPPFHAGWCGYERVGPALHCSAGSGGLQPAAGDSPACRYSRGGVPLPWPSVGLADG